MNRILTIIALMFVTPAWADANPDIGSETVTLMEWLFLALLRGLPVGGLSESTL